MRIVLLGSILFRVYGRATKRESFYRRADRIPEDTKTASTLLYSK